MTTTTEYAVAGMHCNSCVLNVEESLLDVPGVTRAKADLAAGQVAVEHDDTVTDEAVRAAITEAGYQPA
jgi:copper chaperone CopZ